MAETSRASTAVAATPTVAKTAARPTPSTVGPSAMPPLVGRPLVRLSNGLGDAATLGGEPMSDDVRAPIERSFGADLSDVRVHTNSSAADALSARAFAFGNRIVLGSGQSKRDVGLMAHESAHVIQQQGTARVQRLGLGPSLGQPDAAEREAHTASDAVMRGATYAVSERTAGAQVQRLGLSDALNYFADKANVIPGFRMFTIIIGVNPINMSKVERSAANIMRAIVEFIPGGALITRALDTHGVFDKVGSWVEQQIQSLGIAGSAIKAALKEFLDSLGWRDIFDLGGVWNRAKRIFTEPIDRILSFAKGLITGILKFVKDAILMPLAKMAEGTRGWDLLTAVLGSNPITGEAVPRSAETLIGGFMKLIGQQEIWENIQKGKAIPRAWAWFEGALSGLMGMVRAIPTKIMDTLKSLTIQDIVTVAGAFGKIVSLFGGIAADFLSWGLNQVISLLEILFSVVAPGAVPYVAKAKAAFTTIVKNPVGFVGNLVRAGKRGFELFAGNILTHLKTALIKWITGPLGEAGVYIPKAFSLIEIVKLVLSVLGLTWQNIRSKLVKIIPEPVLVGLEKTAGILVTLVKDGPAAAWEQIKTELSELKDQLIAQVTQMITIEVVKAAVLKLVSMLNPAGAVVQAIFAIYNTIMFFVEKISQIGAVVASFIDSVSAIAAGQVDNAAKKVEMTMANTLTVIIAFLAKFAGLGNIPEKVVGIVKKIRQPIDKGLDKIVAWLGTMLKKAGTFVKDKIAGFFKPKSFSAAGESHRLYVTNDGSVTLESKPKRLQNALIDLRKSLPSNSPMIGKISVADQKSGILQTKTTELKAATSDQDIKRLSGDTETLSNEIVALLVEIMYSTGGPQKSAMTRTVITFTAKGNKGEYDRQIGMQKVAINNMLVGDWQKNRSRFTAFGRDKKSDTAGSRRDALIKKLLTNPVSAIKALSADKLLTASHQNQINMILADPHLSDKNKALEPIARVIMDSYGKQKLAVLHTVDQVAGGIAIVYGDDATIFGSTEVNSDIGGQWYRSISAADNAVKDVAPVAKMDLDLKVI